MNKLRKQFEEETGLKSEFNPSYYIEWLEDKLTWRSVDDEMPEEQECIVVVTKNSVQKVIFEKDSHVDWFCRYVVDWLPLPKDE